MPLANRESEIAANPSSYLTCTKSRTERGDIHTRYYHRNILFRHLLPGLIGPVIVPMTLNVATNILRESSLTFLGLGVDPLIPSWGGMFSDGHTYLRNTRCLSVFPGFAILPTILGLNFCEW